MQLTRDRFVPVRPAASALAGRVELPATTLDTEPIEAGALVIVADVVHGVANVSALTHPRQPVRPPQRQVE